MFHAENYQSARSCTSASFTKHVTWFVWTRLDPGGAGSRTLEHVLEVGGAWHVVLVLDFTHDLFEDVFEGDDADERSTRVAHHGHRTLFALERAQQVGDP